MKSSRVQKIALSPSTYRRLSIEHATLYQNVLSLIVHRFSLKKSHFSEWHQFQTYTEK